MQRRKSVDSSDSSDSSDSDSSRGRHGGHVKVKKEKKEKKDKKDKDEKDKGKKDKDKKDKDKEDKDKSDKKKDKTVKGSKAPSYQSPAFPQPPPSQQPLAVPVPNPHYPQYQQSDLQQMSFGFNDPNAGFPAPDSGFAPPPSYGGQHPPPPSGYRVPLSTDTAFASSDQTGYPPLYDADGTSPIFIGSALFENSVHPCKIGPHLNPPAAVPYGGTEHPHHGRYDLLPFVPHQMEWVSTSKGQIPPGRTPIEGGYEENGEKLYHALGVVNGVRVPGKTGAHLGGANIPFGGEEHVVREYEILCWKH